MVPPSKNIDGSTPVNLLGYNLYRNVGKGEGENQVPINTALIAGPSYPDKTFKFGEKYKYFVRAVSLGTNGRQVEAWIPTPSKHRQSTNIHLRNLLNPLSQRPMEGSRCSLPRTLRMI